MRRGLLQSAPLLLLGFAVAAIGPGARAQMLIRVVSLPQLTPLWDELYITGSFNNWDPGSVQWKLQEAGPGVLAISIPSSAGSSFEFKFTRGNWNMVEGTPSGQYVPNRTATYQEGTVLNLSIEGWEDIPGNHTITSGVRILDTDFHIPQLNRTRRIWVLLPPDYFDGALDYPVWYMHDGQNLFDAATSFAGEWQVDESMQALVQAECNAAIIVGIDNGGASRLDEYAPWHNADYDAGGDGEAYALFLINTLKPAIDMEFRTLADRANTYTAGSSMGALISAYLLLQHPGTFGAAGLFSPAFWFNEEELMALAESAVALPGTRVFLTAGQTESGSMVPDINQFAGYLSDAGLDASSLHVHIEPEGQHSEWFWAQQFPLAYSALEACAQMVRGDDPPPLSPEVFPNPATTHVMVQWQGAAPSVLFLADSSGRIHPQPLACTGTPGSRQSCRVSLERLAPGSYWILPGPGQAPFHPVPFVKTNSP